MKKWKKKLYKWFEDQRNKHVPINGVEMKAMTLKLFAQEYPDKPSSDFNAITIVMDGFQNSSIDMVFDSREFAVKFYRATHQRLPHLFTSYVQK